MSNFADFRTPFTPSDDGRNKTLSMSEAFQMIYPTEPPGVVYLEKFNTTGSSDWTDPLAAALTYCQAQTYTPSLRLGAGSYPVSALGIPQIYKPISIVGDNPRTTSIAVSGSTDAFRIAGIGTRATAVQFSNLTLNGNAMTGGYLVNVDFAQDILFNNVIFNNPYNGLRGRQVGRLLLVHCILDTIRGEVGIDLFGANVTRNGQNDQIDFVYFNDVIAQSNLPSVGGTNAVIMVRIDGRVHTVQGDGLRMLNGGIGMQTLNTPGLAANLVPRFIIGSSIEAENMYAECFDFQACREVSPAFLFAAGSHTADNVKLSPNVSLFSPARAVINTAALHGLNTNGAKYTFLNHPEIYNNSLASPGAKSGAYLSGSGVLSMQGGLAGKDTSLPAYTENQKYGVEMDAGFNGIALIDKTDMRGNNVGSLYDNGLSSSGGAVTNCPGYNPRGTAAGTPGASPYTINAGLTQETWNVAGTGISLTIGGLTVPIAATGGTFTINPRQSATITYTTLTSGVATRA